MPRLARLAAVLTLALAVLGCSEAVPGGGARPAEARPELPKAEAGPAPAMAPASPDRGKELVERYECARCHEGVAAAAVPREKHCVRCHQDIRDGSFPAPPAKLAAWREHVEPHTEVPSLAAIGLRVDAAWIENYLL